MDKKQKEITHMGNDNRCETCFSDGKLAERKRILEIIGKAIHHNQDYCELCENYRELQKIITQEKN